MPVRLPIILILDNVRSLFNVGAIFRTADAVRIEKIVLGGLTPCPPRHEISKTALGAVESVPWEYVPNLLTYLPALHAQGYLIAALEQTPLAQDLFLEDPTFPLALIVGHEREGVQPDILKLATQHYLLPMHGEQVHSLNVSTAASIALYELASRFCYDKKSS